MFIDKDIGKIELPNGLVITPELTKSGFESSTYFEQATPYDYGTLPFQWYRFIGGQLEGHNFYINICFYSEDLVSFHASINLHPTDPPKWADWSLEIQSQEKQFHDKLLQSVLGHSHERLFSPENYPELDYSINYKYNWGEVWSGYDGKSGSSSIVISFGSRLKNALDDYNKNFPRESLKKT